MQELFHKIAAKISYLTGTATAFTLAVLIILTWAVTGPLFHFTDTWQLVINTGTTIITFLMVFLIQNTQNRDSKAMQLKLDELIRASTARDSFIDLEDLGDEELDKLNASFQKLHAELKTPLPGLHRLHHQIEIVHSRRHRGPGSRTKI